MIDAIKKDMEDSESSSSSPTSNTRTSESEDTWTNIIQFYLMFPTVVAVMFVFCLVLYSYYALFITFILLSISIFNPYLLRRPLELWLNFGSFAGKLNSNLILFIFFYLILVPASFFRFVLKSIKHRRIKRENTFYRPVDDNMSSKLSDQY